MFKHGGIFYIQHNETGKQASLRTKDKREAARLLNAKNDAAQAPALNRELGRVFLSAIDPAAVSRSWNVVMELFCGIGRESTQKRRKREMNSAPLNSTAAASPWELPASAFTVTATHGQSVQWLAAIPNDSLRLPWGIKAKPSIKRMRREQ